MTMTIDRAREIVDAVASGADLHPPILQREINQALAVCAKATFVEPTPEQLADRFQNVLQTAIRSGL